MVFRRQGRGEKRELDQIGGEYQKGSTGMILIMMTVIKMIFIMMTLSSLFLTGSKTKKQNWGRISKKDERLVLEYDNYHNDHIDNIYHNY